MPAHTAGSEAAAATSQRRLITAILGFSWWRAVDGVVGMATGAEGKRTKPFRNGRQGKRLHLNGPPPDRVDFSPALGLLHPSAHAPRLCIAHHAASRRAKRKRSDDHWRHVDALAPLGVSRTGPVIDIVAQHPKARESVWLMNVRESGGLMADGNEDLMPRYGLRLQVLNVLVARQPQPAFARPGTDKHARRSQ